jgi:membrane protein implicated in regulation of membrane protease activity
LDVNSIETWQWIWLGATVVFAVGEIAVAGSFFLAPFAIAAAMACAAAFAGSSVAISWLVFVVGAVGALAVLRPLAKRLDASSGSSGAGADRWVGRGGVVLSDIPAGPGGIGLVRLEREEWRAESVSGESLPAGTPVTVLRVDGTRLIVRENTV